MLRSRLKFGLFLPKIVINNHCNNGIYHATFAMLAFNIRIFQNFLPLDNFIPCPVIQPAMYSAEASLQIKCKILHCMCWPVFTGSYFTDFCSSIYNFWHCLDTALFMIGELTGSGKQSVNHNQASVPESLIRGGGQMAHRRKMAGSAIFFYYRRQKHSEGL